MICPLCNVRRAKRNCPALGQSICAVCCGTKRQIEIRCPSDCTYLLSSQGHPAAAVVRRQQNDVGTIVRLLRDVGERQARLFFQVGGAIASYRPSTFEAVVDADVADAAASLAATLETSAKGIIYEHRAGSAAGERLANALKPVISEVREKHAASESDVVLMFRRIEEAIGEIKAKEPLNSRAFLDVLGRVMRRESPAESAPGEPDPGAPRLIVP